MCNDNGDGRTPSSSASRSSSSPVSPDIITLTDVLATLDRAEEKKKRRLDENGEDLIGGVFSEAVGLGIVLGADSMDTTWEIDLSGMSIPVARAAVRHVLRRNLLAATAETETTEGTPEAASATLREDDEKEDNGGEGGDVAKAVVADANANAERFEGLNLITGVGRMQRRALLLAQREPTGYVSPEGEEEDDDNDDADGRRNGEGKNNSVPPLPSVGPLTAAAGGEVVEVGVGGEIVGTHGPEGVHTSGPTGRVRSSPLFHRSQVRHGDCAGFQEGRGGLDRGPEEEDEGGGVVAVGSTWWSVGRSVGRSVGGAV